MCLVKNQLQHYYLSMHKAIRFTFSAKKLIFGNQCSQIITQTATEIAKVAAITLGPMGRNVAIENGDREPRITKDGVTVVKHIEYEDRLQDAVCTLIKKSVNSTNRYAGDGTTTSTLLIGQILNQARKVLGAGYFSRQIKEGLMIGRDLGLQFLKMASQAINTQEDFYKVAMIATKGDQLLSKLISEAVSRSDSIKVQKTDKTNSYVEYFSGIKIVAGVPHPQFKNVGDKVQLDYPLVLLDRKGINNIQDIVEVLQIVKKARKQILIVSPKISDSVLSTLIYNKRKQIVEAYPLILPPYGDISNQHFRQLSKLTGATIFQDYSPVSIKEVKYQHLGRASRVQMDMIESTIYGKSQSSVHSAVIYAGGFTQAVILQIYDKIIDALNSVQTSKKYGVVAGGGVTYWRMAQALQQFSGQGEVGVKVLARALKSPRKALISHLPDYYKGLGGVGWQGYDFKTRSLQDLLTIGIWDSYKVGQSVLIDSVSLAHLLLDIEVGVVRLEGNNESNEEVKKIQDTYKL